MIISARRRLTKPPKAPRPDRNPVDKTVLSWPCEPFTETGMLYDSLVWESACGRYRVVRALHHFDPEGHCFACLIKRSHEQAGTDGMEVRVSWDAFGRNQSRVDRYPTLAKALFACAQHAKKTNVNAGTVVGAAVAYGIDQVPGYKPLHPVLKADTSSPKAPKTDKPPKASSGGARISLFGCPVTAVVRWMGKAGWAYQDAVKALAKLGAPAAEATVRIQLTAGKKGLRGDPASLTAADIAQLEQARG